MRLNTSLLLILAVLVVDQVSKIYVKTHFQLEESVDVFSWFKIYFIENEGAAWGTKLSDLLPISERRAKLFLTIFRIFAIGGIGYWLRDILRKGANATLVLAVSLIFAGAIGNIIDSLFYGMIFDDSYGHVATFMAEEPYGSMFYGKVVDMLYFPIVDSHWPEWMPWVGGDAFRFFAPVFNIADTAISTGVGILLVFNKRAFAKQPKEEFSAEDAAMVADDASAEDADAAIDQNS